MVVVGVEFKLVSVTSSYKAAPLSLCNVPSMHRPIFYETLRSAVSVPVILSGGPCVPRSRPQCGVGMWLYLLLGMLIISEDRDMSVTALPCFILLGSVCYVKW